MKIISSLILGLLLVPGLHASQHTAEDTVSGDPATAELGRLAKQTPEQTVQANKLHAAIKYGDIETVGLLLASNVDVNARSSANDNVLRRAFNPDIIQLLLDHKAHINGIDKDKRTALHWQCLGFKSPSQLIKDRAALCIRKLLESKANINAKDRFGRTSFGLLQTSDHNSKPSPNLIPEFLEYGADPNISDWKKSTVLDELRNTLESGNHFIKKENRIPTCKIIYILNNHRKRVDIIDDTLATFSRPLISLIASYDCGNRPADKAKLDALLHDFEWLFSELHRKGELSVPLIAADHFGLKKW